MDIRKKTQFMTMTALLTAIAILIPIIMPFKIVIPPASYTLGSHIAIFIAMFLSPLMAAIMEIAYLVRMVIAFGLILLSLTLYLDSQKSQQPTPFSYQLLLFGFHIFLIILMLKM